MTYANDTNVIEVTEVFIVVQSIANNESVRDGKSNIIRNIAIAAGSLLDQQGSHLDRLGVVLLKTFKQLDHSVAGVNDIFDNKKVLYVGI